MKFRNRSLPASRPSNHSWTAVISWLAMIALIAIAIGGFNEWFHAGLPHSIQVLHLLFVLSTVLLLAVIAFTIEHFTRHLLSSRINETHHRLHLAMACGKSVGWDSNDATGRIEWFGDLQNMFGIPSETFTATANDFYRYVHGEDRERVSQAVTHSRENNEPYSTEFRIMHENGTVHWVTANGRFYYSANGEPERMLGIAVDITDRKRIEEALVKSEEKFAKAFRESPTAISLTSASDHRYIDVNETFQQLTGWTREEVIGRTTFDTGIWIDPSEREWMAKEVLEKHSVRNLEVRFRCKDGKERVGLGSGELIEVEGEPCILAAIIDITDRKLAEEALQQKECELAEAQRSSHTGSWQWHPNTNTLTWSEELYALHGLDPKQPPPSVDDLAKFFAPESWRQLVEVMAQAAQTGRVGNLDVELIRPDGSRRWVYARGQAVFDANGKIASLSGTAQDITERCREEEARRESDERLRLAVQAGRMFVYEWDPVSDMVTRSPEVVEVLGKGEPLQLTRAELLARVHSDVGEFEGSYSRLTPASPGNRMTYRFQRMDGKVVWLEKSTRGIFDSAGNLVKVVGVAADIDDRIKAEQALRDREASFRRVVDHIGDALAVDDPDGHIIFANDRFHNLFGFKPEELPYVTFEDYVAPEYLAKAHDRRDKRKRGELVPTHFEYEGIRRDGSRLWVEADIVPITNEKGELIGTQKLLRDVTERKRAELVLRESEERFRLVANSAPVMIWLSDIDKLCNYFNKQWLDFTGRPLEAELGNGWAEGVHPEDLSECLRFYTEAFDRRERFEMQYRLRRQDGEYRWIFDIGVPRFNADGSFAGYIGSCMDITDQKAAEEALSNMGRKLIEAHEEERTWIGRELHDDINQRLALVAVELDRWMQHGEPSGPEALDYIQQAKARVMDISKDVQALSHRLHSSRLEYLGLGAAAKSFCREFAEQHNVRVQFHQAGLPLTVPKEISLALFRVLQEALQNALKHSRVHDFTVDLHGTSQKIELRVSDSGTGFDQQEAIAHRGLGLISMRERLQLVDGVLSIQTKPGAGTTIYASVPVESEEYQAIAG